MKKKPCVWLDGFSRGVRLGGEIMIYANLRLQLGRHFDIIVLSFNGEAADEVRSAKRECYFEH